VTGRQGGKGLEVIHALLPKVRDGIEYETETFEDRREMALPLKRSRPSACGTGLLSHNHTKCHALCYLIKMIFSVIFLSAVSKVIK